MENLIWYYILFAFAFGIFLLKGLISFIFGDIDMDLDLDGNIDTDVSSAFSFKGLLHFLMGFSTYLSVVGFCHTNSLYVSYPFTVGDYALAVLLGLVFVVGLFYLYKFTLKADHYNNEIPNLDGMKGKVYLKRSDDLYEVMVSTPQGVLNRMVINSDPTKEYNIDDFVTLRYDSENKQYFF